MIATNSRSDKQADHKQADKQTTRYNEHIKSINHPHIKSNFPKHAQYRTQILHKTHRGLKLYTLEKFEIYKHHKTHKNEVLNGQITNNDHICYFIPKSNPPLHKTTYPTHTFNTTNSKVHFQNQLRAPNIGRHGNCQKVVTKSE